MATTLKTLLERIAEGLWPGHFPVKITASSNADKAEFVASTAAYTDASAHAYDGVYIFLLHDAAGNGGAPEGELVRVVSAGFTAADGTFDVSPEFTVAPSTGDIGLFLYGLHVDELIDGINDIQRTLHVPRYTVLSAIPDGNLEDTGTITDYWNDVVTPGATPTEKVTTAGRVLLGTQTLHFITDATGQGTKSNSVAVHETETVLLSVAVMCNSGPAKVGLMNAGDDSEIESATVDEEGYTEVRFTASIPDDCEEVYIQVISTVTISDIYIGYVGLWMTGRQVVDLPPQLADATDLQDVVYLPAGLTSEASDSYIALSKGFAHWPWDGDLRDWEGVTSHRINVGTPISYPLFLKFRSAGSALSALTDTTYAPEELVVMGALSILNDKLGRLNRDGGRLEKAARQRQAYHDMLDGLGLARPRTTWPVQRRVSV